MRVKTLWLHSANALVLLVMQTAFAENPVMPKEPKTPTAAEAQDSQAEQLGRALERLQKQVEEKERLEKRLPKREYKWDVVWTVRFDSKEALVLLRITSGHMMRLSSEGLDWKRRIINSGGETLEWHYPSGEPWYAWMSSKLPDKSMSPMSEAAEPYLKDAISVSARVSDLGPTVDKAANSKEVYFLDDLKNTGPSRPQDLGLVWKGTARKYKSPYKEYYVILKRAPNDASVITCGTIAINCRLRGARLNDYVVVGDISIPRRDLKNWRRYQTLVKSAVSKMIISIHVKTKR